MNAFLRRNKDALSCFKKERGDSGIMLKRLKLHREAEQRSRQQQVNVASQAFTRMGHRLLSVRQRAISCKTRRFADSSE